MGSSFSGPPNPSDQLFSEATSNAGSGPPNPPDGKSEDLEAKRLEELLENKKGAAAGE
jgi:hypothetical protein